MPTAPVSVTVALADKLDTLTGFWAIDEKPTGSKDPYALRRAALGVIRLVLELGASIDLQLVLARQIAIHRAGEKYSLEYRKRLAELELDRIELASGFDQITADEAIARMAAVDIPKDIPFDEILSAANDLLSFIHDRLKVHLRDEGIRHDVIDACLAMPGNDDLTLLVKRAGALAHFLKTDDGTPLLQGFKRANNILTQAEEKDGVEYSFGPDPKLADDETERALFAALDHAEAKIAPAMAAEDFETAMTHMAALRAPIDAFFEAVQINTDNDILRRNRLNLLHRIRQTCLSVADLGKLEG